METKFTIDFFEFSILVEACIPPRPIARTVFFQSVSDIYYHQMDKEERKKLFEWIQLNDNFVLEKEDCNHFYARFDPNNQYIVHTDHKNKLETKECYLYNGKYHLSEKTSILAEYIVKIEHKTE